MNTHSSFALMLTFIFHISNIMSTLGTILVLQWSKFMAEITYEDHSSMFNLISIDPEFAKTNVHTVPYPTQLSNSKCKVQTWSWLYFDIVTRTTRTTRTTTTTRTPAKVYQKKVSYRSEILHMDLTWWKRTFSWRRPLMEDNLWWKMTFNGWWPLMEDYL